MKSLHFIILAIALLASVFLHSPAFYIGRGFENNVDGISLLKKETGVTPLIFNEASDLMEALSEKDALVYVHGATDPGSGFHFLQPGGRSSRVLINPATLPKGLILASCRGIKGDENPPLWDWKGEVHEEHFLTPKGYRVQILDYSQLYRWHWNRTFPWGRVLSAMAIFIVGIAWRRK